MNTPLIRQYRTIKSQYTRHILFFRLGDFYEMFDNDALEASKILGLTLTARNGMKMCGVPHHVAPSYIEKLVKAGKKVAICEQVQDSKGGAIMERSVTEVVTPGTYTEIDRLNPSRNNFLVSLYASEGMLAAAWIDVSTGEFTVSEQKDAELFDYFSAQLERLQPREIILQESIASGDQRIMTRCKEMRVLVNSYPDWAFEQEKGFERACRHFQTMTLKAFEIDESSALLAPVAALFEYLDTNLHASLTHIRRINVEHAGSFLRLNESAQKNLELLRTASSSVSLFETLNYCQTPMGERLLGRWILAPLCAADEIEKRLEALSLLHKNQQKLATLRRIMQEVFDVERVASRLGMLKAHPKDIVSLGGSLSLALQVLELLEEERLILGFDTKRSNTRIPEMIERIDAVLLPDAPLQYHEGGVIAKGHDGELDALQSTLDNYESDLQRYLETEKAQSGIPFLKLKSNRVLGVFFEIPKSQTPQIPDHFILRQTVSSGQRYTTEALIAIEQKRMNAEERVYGCEQALFIAFRKSLLDYLSELLSLAKELAYLDVLQSFAWAATLHHYTRPTIYTDRRLRIRGGRHPVVERSLRDRTFVPNDTALSEEEKLFGFVTGPNMAGKSTYLRQTALIVIMAQMGSFVPAEQAEIGLVDKLFCRVGASDNIARGESTFLVEMLEASAILHAATGKSLIIMDEVGRGTSTLDGLALAWAISEYILDRICARTLFATHYHELASLDHPSKAMFCIRATKEKGRIVFSHRLSEGIADASYGIDVARLAGVPPAVISRARALLSGLSVKHHTIPEAPTETVQEELFDTEDLLRDELAQLDLNAMTPLDALNALARLKKLSKS